MQLSMMRPVPGTLQLALAGTWRIGEALPPARLVRDEITAERPERVVFATREIVAWDSALVVFVRRVLAIGRTAGVAVELDGVPSGVKQLIALAEATPIERTPPARRPSLLARIGRSTIGFAGAGRTSVVALGELTIAVGRLLRGKANLRRSDLWLQIQLTGPNALGIVALVSCLLGLILAFVAAVQLRQFGAAMYVADLVAIAMVRVLGAVVAAIVLAGRTGAAYAAELGTMRVTDEINALSILGIAPVEFLVLPRVLAVTVMMPLLSLYAALLGIVGGALVGIGVMDVPARLYFDQTVQSVSLGDLIAGLVQATTFGLLIGMAGCFTGLRASPSAAGVGKATTSAVVSGIVLVVVACGAYAVIFYTLGI